MKPEEVKPEEAEPAKEPSKYSNLLGNRKAETSSGTDEKTADAEKSAGEGHCSAGHDGP